MIQICICQVFDTNLYHNIIMVINFYNNKIKELRNEQKLSQRQLAIALNTSQANLSRWEKGLIEPSIVECWKMADFFDVTLDYLCGRKDY